MSPVQEQKVICFLFPKKCTKNIEKHRTKHGRTWRLKPNSKSNKFFLASRSLSQQRAAASTPLGFNPFFLPTERTSKYDVKVK